MRGPGWDRDRILNAVLLGPLLGGVPGEVLPGCRPDAGRL